MFDFINRVDKVIWPPYRDSSAKSLYGGQITLSTLLIKLNIY